MSGGVSKNLTFWGLVGVVMTALHLKDRWEDYKQLSTDEGRITLDGPTVYTDEEGDIGLEGSTRSVLDTEIPIPKSKRKRARQCCVCCGMNCGIFWKAFGIVLLGFVIWNVFKLVKWSLTPSPSGLENMPKFSTSLGCLDASHLYQSTPKLVYTAPPNSDAVFHTLDVRGGAVGTLIVAYEDESDSDGVRYEVTVRTDKQELLNNVDVRYTVGQADSDKTSQFALDTPVFVSGPGSSCMRYDITMFIPTSLKNLTVRTRTPTHVKFSDSRMSSVPLDDLTMSMLSASSDNMLLPSASIQARFMSLAALGGWIVGDVSIYDSTEIVTARGNALTNVRIHPADGVPLDDHTSLPTAVLRTQTGQGRTDITYHPSTVRRPIDSQHLGAAQGDMYLNYKGGVFKGKVDLTAKSFTASGLQGGLGEDRWVGDQDGVDRLVVKNMMGWVGLYFSHCYSCRWSGLLPVYNSFRHDVTSGPGSATRIWVS